NTVAVLGLGIPRRVVQEQIEQIRALSVREQAPADTELLDIAGALLYVEATLSGMAEDYGRQKATAAVTVEQFIPREHLDNAHSALIREARNGLEQAKNCIVEFIASHWDHRQLEEVPN